MTAAEKEIQAFREMFEAHAARIIEKLPDVSVFVLEHAIVLAWRGRKEFDPAKQTLALWFAGLVQQAYRITGAGERASRSIEEMQVVAVFRSDEPEPARHDLGSLVFPERFLRGAAPMQDSLGLSNEWRYRFFDGWLPLRPVVHVEYDDPEITVACRNIDERKVAIANWVRGSYDPALLDLED